MSNIKWANTPLNEENEHWISVSDLMAGLMMIFLFIAVIYINDVQKEKNRIEKIAVTWNETQEKLYQSLNNEFKEELPKWGALLDKDTLSIRFIEPSILFDTGEYTPNSKFQFILRDFFPRYIDVLDQFRDDIAEVRIEGHTSSAWRGAKDETEAYFKNMRLSQGRTRAVLEFCLGIDSIKDKTGWVKSTITANGLSSSKPVLLPDGQEDAAQSRRVEFRTRTKAETRILEILHAGT